MEAEHATAAASLLSTVAAAWQPRPVISTADWSAANIWLPPETSATPGRYDLDRYPYVRGVLDAVDNLETEVIVLMWATQLGKTTLLQTLLAATAVLSPVPAMLGTPDKDSLYELRDKFYLMCESSEALRSLIPPPRLRNNRWIDVGNLRCHLAYSYNTQRMSGKSCALCLATELDRWRQTKTHGNPTKLIAQRVKAFLRSTIVYESTPTTDASRIAALYADSDRRRFLVPCPRCNQFQELRFFPLTKGAAAGRGGVVGLKDRRGNFLAPDDVLESAHYLCEQGCKIRSDQKSPMVANGQWVPTGQALDKKGKLTGKPRRSPRIAGFRLSSLYAEVVSFGRIAAEYVACRDKPEDLRVFWNDWLCKTWTRRISVPKWQELWRRLRGSHPPGVVPPWALFLTAGADVGPSYVRWTVRAWGEGSTSALVDWGTTHQVATRRSSHLEGLIGAVLAREFPFAAANQLGETSLRVRLTNLDCGYQPRLIHDFVRSLRAQGLADRVYQVVGRDELKSGEPWRSTLVERSARTGKAYAGGQMRWEINRRVWNQDLVDRWRIPLDQPGAWWLTDAQLGHAELYLRELTNEGPIKGTNKLGRSVTKWEKIDRNTGNHFWDVEIYALAAADMITGGDWQGLAERIRTARQGPPRENEQGDAGVGARDSHRGNDFSAR